MTSMGLHPLSFIRRKLANFVIRLLTRPITTCPLRVPNDMAGLKRNIRKGDVILVDGNERISECIKYLSQSSWSHAAIYVGDEALRGDAERRERLMDEYGPEARYLIVEAEVSSGVILVPLVKYQNFHIRVCRPCNLAAADLQHVLNFVLSHVGDTYDLKNIVDLARYFLPLGLVPARLRAQALAFGSGEPTRVICSSLIAAAFQHVKFPIIPNFEERPAQEMATDGRGGLLGLILRRRRPPAVLLRMVSPSLITPRDFDLSPYFDIIKFDNTGFDYREITWAEEELTAQPRTL